MWPYAPSWRQGIGEGELLCDVGLFSTSVCKLEVKKILTMIDSSNVLSNIAKLLLLTALSANQKHMDCCNY